VLLVQLPWLLLLLTVAVLPAFLGEAHFASLGYSLLFQWTPERRYSTTSAIWRVDESAKEVNCSGCPISWSGVMQAVGGVYEANKQLAVRRNIVSTLLVTVGTLGYYAPTA